MASEFIPRVSSHYPSVGWKVKHETKARYARCLALENIWAARHLDDRVVDLIVADIEAGY